MCCFFRVSLCFARWPSDNTHTTFSVSSAPPVLQHLFEVVLRAAFSDVVPAPESPRVVVRTLGLVCALVYADVRVAAAAFSSLGVPQAVGGGGEAEAAGGVGGEDDGVAVSVTSGESYHWDLLLRLFVNREPTDDTRMVRVYFFLFFFVFFRVVGSLFVRVCLWVISCVAHFFSSSPPPPLPVVQDWRKSRDAGDLTVPLSAVMVGLTQHVSRVRGRIASGGGVRCCLATHTVCSVAHTLPPVHPLVDG